MKINNIIIIFAFKLNNLMLNRFYNIKNNLFQEIVVNYWLMQTRRIYGIYVPRTRLLVNYPRGYNVECGEYHHEVSSFVLLLDEMYKMNL